jgi:hypothetical protein
VIAVLTRNEHCPPHVHVGTDKWNARYLFSFWHDSVDLWDVTPAQNEPNFALLEGLRQVIKRPPHLRNARELWWRSRRTLCLDNQMWDPVGEEVVSPRVQRKRALAIQAAGFEAKGYKTILRLAGQAHPLEIAL